MKLSLTRPRTSWADQSDQGIQASLVPPWPGRRTGQDAFLLSIQSRRVRQQKTNTPYRRSAGGRTPAVLSEDVDPCVVLFLSQTASCASALAAGRRSRTYGMSTVTLKLRTQNTMVPYATTAAAQVIELVQAFGDVTVDKRQSATWYDCGRQCGPVLGDGEASGSSV